MSSYDQVTATETTTTPAQDIHLSTDPPNAPSTPSVPVEMTNLASKDTSDLNKSVTSSSHEPHPIGPVRTDTNTALAHSMQTTSHPPVPAIPEQQVTRTTTGAIGPSSDQPVPPAKDETTAGPTLLITLLLTSGARHPFKLDHKYLAKRTVEVPQNDPFNMSVYKLKELILREWRDEWELKPSSPSSIRLISFGKLLDDKTALKDYKFNHETPNVLHMTIKPSDFVEEEDAKAGKGGFPPGRDDGETRRSPRCRCVVM